MKKLIRESEDIFAMSNVRGKYIKVEQNIPFSFYYSPRNSSHGPRVKVLFNPDRMRQNLAGTLKLCDDWLFVPGKDDLNVSNSKIASMKQFFRKYLILFLLVWENLLDDPDPEDYFRGDIDLHKLITLIDFYPEFAKEMDEIKSISELEDFCRKNNLVNFYGN